MSINLRAFVNNKEIELYQTPTHITHMCLMNDNGSLSQEVNDYKARRALWLYLIWVESTLNGVWEDHEECIMANKSLNEHINKVQNIINKKSLIVIGV